MVGAWNPSVGGYDRGMDDLRGKLLLASPDMGDPNFSRAVILVVQHSADGALGLVLNQPTGVAVSDVLQAMPEGFTGSDEDDDPTGESEAAAIEGVIPGAGGEALYRGGPCDGPLMVLHGDPVHGQEKVLEGVYFASERQYIEPILTGAAGPAKYFAGYSGWGAGQLEGELAQSAWVVMDADAAAVLSRDQDDAPGGGAAWKTLIRVKKSRDLLTGFNPDLVPRDPSMN